MEAIIKTENKTLFDALLQFLKTLNITVETKEKKSPAVKKNTAKAGQSKKSGIDLNDFSFFKSMEATKDFKGSICDALIEERRSS